MCLTWPRQPPAFSYTAPVGFYPQPNDWTCGPFALKHALVALGQMVHESDIAKQAQTHWWSGTDELRLAHAAHIYGCDLDYVRSTNAERSRKRLVADLRTKVPAILCVDDWEHWITVLRHHQGKFVVVDSNLDPVLNVLTWPQLRRRWVYCDVDYDEDDPPTIYDYYAVRPRTRQPIHADFSLARVRHLRHSRNRKLAEHWDAYLDDLLTICRPRSARMNEPLSMGEFLRRNEKLIVSRTEYWHGDVEAGALARLMDNFQFVAETYGLVIPAVATKRALVDLAVLATMWLAAARGTAEMYGDGP